MRRHVIVIRCSFQDALQSRRRLEISKATCIPSLKAQKNKNYEIILRVSRRDPLLDKRVSAFKDIGVPVQFDHVSGDLISTRMDDDDVVAVDFTSQIQTASLGRNYGAISLACGILFDSGNWYKWTFPGNMFQSILCNGSNEVFRHSHRSMPNLRGSKVIYGEPSWVWVRHPFTITTSLEGYQKEGRIKFPKDRFPGVSFPTVMKLSRE